MKDDRLSGFTLIELLIVVAIIAILAAIAVPNFLEAQVRAKVSRAKADLRSLLTAVESYAVDNSKYPLHMTVDQIGNQVTDPYLGQGVSPPYGEYHFSRKTNITTPIAYMSSFPEDVFFKLGAPVSYNNPTPATGKQPARRIYLWSNATYISGDKAEAKAAYGEHRLWSRGPDLTGRDIYLSNPTDSMRVYDPTNGTLSTGDIWRTHKNPDGSRPHIPGLVN